eukprot:4763426-Pleurochrysis_carterae.AAC.1
MRLWEALSSTSTSLSRMRTMAPFFVRNGRSTSHLYFCVVVPLAVTMRVLLGRRLPFTASDVLVMQCIPAPVSPSHIAFPPDAGANAGINSMTYVKISFVSASLRTFAKRSLKAASPRVMSAMSAKRALHIASPCGIRCRISATRA